MKLHHAICAVSALNLNYRGQVSLEEAIEHYHQALSARTTASNPDGILSDGVFLRHLLLFIYDICMTVDADGAGADMWARHMDHLTRLAVLRNERFGQETHTFIVWKICLLDMEACLLGNGSCDFVRTVLAKNMLPTLAQQVPTPGPSLNGPYWPSEAQILPAILRLNQGVVIHTAKLAQAAQNCREQLRNDASPATYAHAQATVARLQVDMLSFWSQGYPDFLESDSPTAARRLPPRAQAVFEDVSISIYA